MDDFGRASRRKVERAEKHIGDLNALLVRMRDIPHHAVSVQRDPEHRNWITVHFDPSALRIEEAALIIGDALHNLRSALDILWHDVIRKCDGIPSNYTRFLIRDTRDELITRLNYALEKKQISDFVHEFVLNTIKPYETGNYAIWALDDLNVRDKHQLIIPVLKWTFINGIRLQDDEGVIYDEPVLVADRSWKGMLPLDPFYRKNLTVKDQGETFPTVLFDQGFPFQGKPILPEIKNIAIVVTGTVKAFELLFGKR